MGMTAESTFCRERIINDHARRISMTQQITGATAPLPYHTGTYDIMGGQRRSHCVMDDTNGAIGASAPLLR
ncbi:hypothetical protein BDV30DRAFT_216795 [Aspergillus minisclerotigenes]|uniref:Uncharacterized protein n=1 Tax=Aspergillus minisclerotigenes TaxID=656917 RepID=A0A5N6IS28_9EURO|nr:hypothetical protein BDV30DRAFT_216795 [Aspergillus minisclerotigenes]